MRVRLKGINRAKVKLANGERITYYYAWRGGPRLVGEPGSPGFIASYYAAIQSRREPDRSTFHSVIAGYKSSQDFLGQFALANPTISSKLKRSRPSLPICRLPRSMMRGSHANLSIGATAWPAVRGRRIMPGQF